MGHDFVDNQSSDKVQRDSPGEGAGEDSDLPRSTSKSTLGKLNSDNSLMLNLKRSQSSRRCRPFQRMHGLESRIPKGMVSLDEKYLRHCLELIHDNSSKTASLKVSVNLGVTPNWLNPNDKFLSPDCSTQLIFDCSLAASTGEVVSCPAGEWIVGSIMGSNSMISIMKNPLFQRLGIVDGNFLMSNSRELHDFPSEEAINSPTQLSLRSSVEPGKEMPASGAYESYGFDDAKHRLFASATSENSSSRSTERSSLSTPAQSAVSQAMLHVTWKGRIPYFVFSLDEQKEIFVASLIDIESTNHGAAQHLYRFQSRPRSQKCAVNDKEPCHLVIAEMKVTTSLSLCSCNSKVVETDFVLSINCEISEETQTSANNLKRGKGLPKKMVELLRNSYSSKQRSTSRFDGTINPILENGFSDASQDFCSSLNTLGSDKNLKNLSPANFELAAIAVRAHCESNEHQAEGGGWGLKFLKRVGVKKTPESHDETVTSDYCTRNTGNCSTSIDVIVPAGIHGGPRTRNSGPSTLLERWKSGGQCDCGGWDLGCPITTLKKRATEYEAPYGADMQGVANSFDLYLQGSKQNVPCVRMMDVHEGLYLIHFQSTLSALQCFAIAVAHIHSQSPILRL